MLRTGSRNREGSSRASLDSTAIDTLLFGCTQKCSFFSLYTVVYISSVENHQTTKRSFSTIVKFVFNFQFEKSLIKYFFWYHYCYYYHYI